ncbi:MAG: HAD family hydrolase [Lachnospiraceae bacterium]|nr:HAD family hydrolase [Lachnospiraceae bacterium]
MIVSFDLDDTLFVSPDKFKTEEELKFPWNKIYKERLRLGTISLMKQLKDEGIHIWIYTTSFRSERYIRGLFRHYGIKWDGVVNGIRHAKEVQGNKMEPMPSKYPGKYRIDLHIDDDVSVLQNGRLYGFKVLLVGPQDDNWTKKILDIVHNIRKSEKRDK